MTRLKFDRRVAVVTGAGRGLGREFALELARRGCSVVVNDIGSSSDAARYGADGSPPEPASAVVEEIRDAGGRAVVDRSSVSDEDAAPTIVEHAVAEFGRIDILINNAGVVITDPFTELTAARLKANWDVHVLGSFLVSHRAWSYMAAQHYGRILNICSVDGVVFGNKEHIAYDAAKGGLAGLTRGMSSESLAVGIHVNGLLPGAYTRGQKSVDQSLTPVREIDMSPRLVAPTAAWLVHEQCDINGAFFTSSSGRLGRVFSGVSEGFQTTPEQFSMEAIQDNWDCAQALEPYISPATAQEYNAFRTRSFREAVNGAGGQQA